MAYLAELETMIAWQIEACNESLPLRVLRPFVTKDCAVQDLRTKGVVRYFVTVR